MTKTLSNADKTRNTTATQEAKLNEVSNSNKTQQLFSLIKVKEALDVHFILKFGYNNLRCILHVITGNMREFNFSELRTIKCNQGALRAVRYNGTN